MTMTIFSVLVGLIVGHWLFVVTAWLFQTISNRKAKPEVGAISETPIYHELLGK